MFWDVALCTMGSLYAYCGAPSLWSGMLLQFVILDTSSRKYPSCPLNTVYVFSVCAVYVRVCMLRYYCQALDMQPILAVVHQSGCTDRVTFICVLETCRSEKNIVKSIAVLTQTTRHFQFRDASDHCSTVSTL